MYMYMYTYIFIHMHIYTHIYTQYYKESTPLYFMPTALAAAVARHTQTEQVLKVSQCKEVAPVLPVQLYEVVQQVLKWCNKFCHHWQ